MSSSRDIPLLITVLGWFVIITIPVTFFVFGWRDIGVQCQRLTAQSLPDCHVAEQFAMGLYTREVAAYGVTGIGYKSQSSRSTNASSQTVLTSTVVLETEQGDVAVSEVSSNVDSGAKRELILEMRKYLERGDALEFNHHAAMHSIFGYLGLFGVIGLLSILVAVVRYQMKRRAYLRRL